jgi:hypothetical protein
VSYSNAIWDDWFLVAGPLNKVTGWLTIALTVLWWALAPISTTGYNSILLLRYTWILVFVVLAGFFYLIILQKPIEAKDLSKSTHIWLLICLVLSVFSIGGVFIWAQFALVGILSDTPFWRVLFQGGVKYY